MTATISPETLRRLIESHGITQSRAADLCYAKLRTMQQWLAGDRAMPLASSEVLNIALADLKRKFNSQRNGAKARNVPFEMTFDEWLSVWQGSGKLHLRGSKVGQYVMARHGDLGPYKVGNVSIILCSDASYGG